MESSPFPYLILDDLLDPQLVAAVADSVPDPGWPHWVKYDGPQERKRTCRSIHHLSDAACRLFHYLNSTEWTERLTELSGIEGLVADPTFHGGGLHCTDRGGYLDVHVDYALHPMLKLERRLNLVLFLNRHWCEDWNGALEFWDADAAACAKRIWPRFNRLVLWEPSDIAFHGHPEPLQSPANVSRASVAVYYLSAPRSPQVVRTRALFVPRR